MPILAPDKYKDSDDDKFGKDTYVKGRGKKKPKKKGKKMSRAEFLKMVREKKYKKNLEALTSQIEERERRINAQEAEI